MRFWRITLMHFQPDGGILPGSGAARCSMKLHDKETYRGFVFLNETCGVRQAVTSTRWERYRFEYRISACQFD